MIWSILHTVFSIFMLVTALVMLRLWRDRYILAERLGLGLLGGAGLLRINVIWEHEASPYYEWAPTLMTLGFALVLFGRAFRDWRHSLNNERQVVSMREELRARGRHV